MSVADLSSDMVDPREPMNNEAVLGLRYVEEGPRLLPRGTIDVGLRVLS